MASGRYAGNGPSGKGTCNFKLLHQRAQDLVRHPREPWSAELRATSLRKGLPQEPVAILNDRLHAIAEYHRTMHVRWHGGTAMQHTVVVHANHGVLWPVESAHKLLL